MLSAEQTDFLNAVQRGAFEEVKNRMEPGEYHKEFLHWQPLDPDFLITDWNGVTGRFTALFLAIYYDYPMVVHSLIRHGTLSFDDFVEVQFTDKNNIAYNFSGTCMEYIMQYSNETFIAEMSSYTLNHTTTIEITPEGNAISLSKNPAYLLALLRGYLFAAEKLLHKANISALQLNEQVSINQKILTPLQAVTFSGKSKLVKWMLEHGANATATTLMQGLLAAAEGEAIENYSSLSYQKLIAPPMLPLHIACNMNNTETGLVLYQAGAELMGKFDLCAENFPSWFQTIQKAIQDESISTLTSANKDYTTTLLLTVALFTLVLAILFYDSRKIKHYCFPSYNLKRKNSDKGDDLENFSLGESRFFSHPQNGMVTTSPYTYATLDSSDDEEITNERTNLLTRIKNENEHTNACRP